MNMAAHLAGSIPTLRLRLFSNWRRVCKVSFLTRTTLAASGGLVPSTSYS